jgi:hypothetical protein
MRMGKHHHQGRRRKPGKTRLRRGRFWRRGRWEKRRKGRRGQWQRQQQQQQCQQHHHHHQQQRQHLLKQANLSLGQDSPQCHHCQHGRPGNSSDSHPRQ